MDPRYRERLNRLEATKSHQSLLRSLLCELSGTLPKRGSRLPATLAPDGDASRSQQSDPNATATLGTRTVRPCAEWWLVTTPHTRA